jgi:hypothetical protein
LIGQQIPAILRLGRVPEAHPPFWQGFAMRDAFLRALILALAPALTGCTPSGPPGTIHFVGRVIEHAPPNATRAEREAVALRNRLVEDKPVQFRVAGTGTCDRLRVKFGDGTSAILWNANLDWDGRPDTGALVTHTYASGPGHWRGPKTITAEPVRNCQGGYSAVDTVVPEEMRYAFAQPGPLCGSIGAVRAGTVITSAPVKNPEDKITFSAFSIYGISGAPGSTASAAFPFPGLRAYSLVFRVGGPGGQVAQGGTNASFTVAQDGDLELCINDDLPSDNFGAWGILLSVDERGAP